MSLNRPFLTSEQEEKEMESQTTCYTPNLLERYNKNPKEIKEINHLESTGDIEIVFESGDKIFLDRHLKFTGNEMKAQILVDYRQKNTMLPNNGGVG